MCSPVNKKSSIDAVAEWVGKFQIQTTPDGLTMIPPATEKELFHALAFPQHLADWLRDIRLLRGIPLCYLVPDADLLPPEAIRFFHVDYTWIDRVIDGVFAAANTGTVDSTFTYVFLQSVRAQLDEMVEDLATVVGADGKPVATGWKYGANPMTGMLIRSELARRWPDMIVTAFSDSTGAATKQVAVLRAEAISKDVYFALFAGLPKRVDIREPNVGIRFGVEGDSPSNYAVDKRDANGADVMADGKRERVPIKVISKRCLDLPDLKNKLGQSRSVALHLEQRPYLQIFLTTVDESKGSLAPVPSIPFLKLKNGRQIKIEKLIAKFNEIGG